MGDDCSIWFNAVLRGYVNFIRMGNKVNVQDGAVIEYALKIPKLQSKKYNTQIYINFTSILPKFV